jgi:hypothetical protein
MVSETAAFSGIVVLLVVGMVVMLLGVLQGGVNLVLGAGSAMMVASVGWLALSLGMLEPPEGELGH